MYPWGFLEIRGTSLGALIIRIIVFWGLYWGPLILGNYHIGIVYRSVSSHTALSKYMIRSHAPCVRTFTCIGMYAGQLASKKAGRAARPNNSYILATSTKGSVFLACKEHAHLDSAYHHSCIRCCRAGGHRGLGSAGPARVAAFRSRNFP